MHSIVICLTTVLVLGRLKIVESLKLILVPRLHSVSNQTTHFGGRDGSNIVSVISSVAYLVELIVRTFLLRAMGSNWVILTLEQQLGVLEDSRTIVSKWTLLLQRMQWCFKWQSTRSFNDSDTASSRLPVRSSCIMLDFFMHQLNADSRVRTHIYTHI